MDVSLNTASSGVFAAQVSSRVQAHNVANINTESFVRSRTDLADANPGTRIVGTPKAGGDLTDNIVSLKTAKHANTANLKVMHVADEMLGTVIDLKR